MKPIAALLAAALLITPALNAAPPKKPAVAQGTGGNWGAMVQLTPAGTHVVGNPAAKVKLIEYVSYTCPHCAKLAQDGAAALTEKYVNTGKVSWEFRSFAIHPQDVPLTMLVRCGPAESYFPLVEQVYTNFDALSESTQKGAGKLGNMGAMPPAQRFTLIADALGFTEFFAARGIARDQAHTCLANAAAAEKIAAESDAASKQGIDSTPTLLINGAKT